MIERDIDVPNSSRQVALSSGKDERCAVCSNNCRSKPPEVSHQLRQALAHEGSHCLVQRG